MILRAFQSKEMEGFKVEMLGGLLEAVWPCQDDGFTQLTRNKVMGKKNCATIRGRGQSRNVNSFLCFSEKIQKVLQIKKSAGKNIKDGLHRPHHYLIKQGARSSHNRELLSPIEFTEEHDIESLPL